MPSLMYATKGRAFCAQVCPSGPVLMWRRYAGAGLFDSVQSRAPKDVPVDFSNDPLLADQAFQSSVLGRISAASAAVERAAGSPQDIEGAITADGKLYIVQTRPQV